MLKTLNQEEYEQYIDFAYTLALDISKSAFPSYCDGIKTKVDFIERSKRCFERTHEEILLFVHEGSVEGWIHYYALPEDDYVSFCAFNIRNHAGIAVDEVITYLGEKYSCCRLYFGLPEENNEVISRLESLHFSKEEESFVDILHFDNSPISLPVGELVPVTKRNFSDFAKLHEVHDDDMYWNNLRLQAVIEDWKIYLIYENEIPVGAIYFTYMDKGMMEIFGVDYASSQYDMQIFNNLLLCALHEAKNAGMKHVVFFTGSDEHPWTKQLGFQMLSKYVLYSKDI